MLARWFTILLLAFAPCSAAEVGGRHPQDGPHTDIRITVSDRDVRMTVGLNLPFLDEAIPTQRETTTSVAESEEAMVEDAFRRLIAQDTVLTIDGVRVAPVIERLEIERLSEDSLYLFPNSGRSALTRFNAVAVYPCKTPPRTVSIRWAHYPPSALSSTFEEVGDTPPPMVIDAQLKAEGRVRILRFSETDPERTWSAGGDTPETAVEALPAIEVDLGRPVPVLSLGVVFIALGAGVAALVLRRRVMATAIVLVGLGAGAAMTGVGDFRFGHPTIPEDRAVQLFAVLHSNIYRAFDFTSENDIYDTLAISVTGDLLDSLYKQIRLGLVQAENGGGVGRVTALELRTAEIMSLSRHTEGVAFEVYAEWEVEGTVYHFGHSHAKQTPYAGIFRVTQTPEGWRIDQAEPREREPLLAMPGEL